MSLAIPQFRVFAAALMVAMAMIASTAGSALACIHEMEAITPKENALYMAEWQIEQRQYRKSIKTIMAQFNGLPAQMAKVEEGTELTYEEEQAALLLTRAIARTKGKWALTKNAGKLNKKKRTKNLQWATATVETLTKRDSLGDLTATTLELKFALGADPKTLHEEMEDAFTRGLVYDSKGLEILASLRKAAGEDPSELLAQAKETRGYEKETPKPEYEVLKEGENNRQIGMFAEAEVLVGKPVTAVAERLIADVGDSKDGEAAGLAVEKLEVDAPAQAVEVAEQKVASPTTL